VHLFIAMLDFHWGAMRWLSLFVALIYLNLLCAPQVFAVHDMRISSLSDKQLQALTPSIHPHTITISQDGDNDPPALLSDIVVSLYANVISQGIACAVVFSDSHSCTVPEARAPPAFLTVI
jgi:hypothetical protein